MTAFDIRTERTDLDAIRQWQRTERLAARESVARTVAAVALTATCITATVRLISR